MDKTSNGSKGIKLPCFKSSGCGKDTFPVPIKTRAYNIELYINWYKEDFRKISKYMSTGMLNSMKKIYIEAYSAKINGDVKLNDAQKAMLDIRKGMK